MTSLRLGERRNTASATKLATLRKGGRQGVDEERVKRVGDDILNHARVMIREIANDHEDFEFKLNRWVYARLQPDERKKKGPVKRELWEMGAKSCGDCRKRFRVIKGVEIHRKDPKRAYSVDNCELLCRGCHQKK